MACCRVPEEHEPFHKGHLCRGLRPEVVMALKVSKESTVMTSFLLQDRLPFVCHCHGLEFVELRLFNVSLMRPFGLVGFQSGSH